MRRFLFLLPVGILSLAACSHTSDPPDEDDCLDPKFRAPVEVTINVDQSLLPYTEVDSTRYESEDSIDAASTRARERGNEGWRLRYYLAAYRRNEKDPTEVLSSFDNKITMNLAPDKYTFVGWADRVPEDGNPYYFYMDDFNELLLKHKYEYVADDPYKVPYRGSVYQSVAYTTTSTSVDCKPAMGKYRLIATDSLTFNPGKVLITYLGSIPSAVHGLSGRINYSWDDMYYEARVEKRDSVHEIARDYLLSHDDEETKVAVRIEIYDDQNFLRARIRQIEIPLRNGGITTVKGNFFSILDLDNSTSTGGITIDKEFEETVEIEI